jgi:hypothetical protein
MRLAFLVLSKLQKALFQEGATSKNGRLTGFSLERLMHFLTALGKDVEIIVKSKPRNRKQGALLVHAR